jgi:hypothetical protein
VHWPLTRGELGYLTLMLFFWGIAADITSRWGPIGSRWRWRWTILQLAFFVAAAIVYGIYLKSRV